MPKKITDLSEGDIEPPAQPEATEPEDEQAPAPDNPAPGNPVPLVSRDDPGTELMAIFAPTSGPPIVRPEDDRVLFYVSGAPVLASECAEFGCKFVGLLAFMTKITGMDNSPEPQGKKPNYLRVTCTKCDAMTVTIAPQMEKFCSRCGALLPTPDRFSPAQHTTGQTPGGDGQVIDAQYVVLEDDNNGRE